MNRQERERSRLAALSRRQKSYDTAAKARDEKQRAKRLAELQVKIDAMGGDGQTSGGVEPEAVFFRSSTPLVDLERSRQNAIKRFQDSYNKAAQNKAEAERMVKEKAEEEIRKRKLEQIRNTETVPEVGGGFRLGGL